jgi:hypothetical protein
LEELLGGATELLDTTEELLDKITELLDAAEELLDFAEELETGASGRPTHLTLSIWSVPLSPVEPSICQLKARTFCFA